MTKIILLSITTGFLFGCVTTSPLTDSSYMGQTAIPNMTYDQLKEKLQRTESKSKHTLLTDMSIGAYAVPLTAPLIIVYEQEIGKKQLRSNDETQKIINDRIKNETQKCFIVTVETPAPIENAEFKHWVSKVRTQTGELIDVELFNTKGTDSVPHINSGWTGGIRPWINSTVACAKKEFSHKEDFSLVLSNIILSDIENIELKWTFAK